MRGLFNWRFYSNNAVTPTVSLANEQTQPNVNNTNIIRLRLQVNHDGIMSSNTIGLRYSTDGSNFTLLSSGGHWNYANGLGAAGAIIATNLLTGTTEKGLYCEAATAFNINDPIGYIEYDFSIAPTANVLSGQIYTFQVVFSDTFVITPGSGVVNPTLLMYPPVYVNATGSGAGTGAGTATASGTANAAADATGAAAATGGGEVLASASGATASVQVSGEAAATGAGDVSLFIDADIGVSGETALTGAGDVVATGGADVEAVASGEAAATGAGDTLAGVDVSVEVSGAAAETGAGSVLMEGDTVVDAVGSGAETGAGDISAAGTASVAATGASVATGAGSVTVALHIEGVPAFFINSRGQLDFSRAPRLPRRALAYAQARIESGGAVPYITDYSRRDEVIDLPLRLTAAEVTALKTFFHTAAHGRAFPFDYVDVSGNSVPVKFASSLLPKITEKAYNAYDCTLQLRLQ